MTSAEVAVVGAGPAGLMAASVLAESGHKVVVFDARRSPGRKFLLAGRSGLNLTHSEPIDDLLARYGPDRPFVESAIRQFGPIQLRAWADGLGGATFVGSSGRVFPESMRATPLLRAWLQQLATQNVDFRAEHRWVGWGSGTELRFATPEGPVVSHPAATILALGGASWPLVSSDGSWTEIVRGQGVAVQPMQASNCGLRVAWSTVMKERFSGAPIKNVAVAVAGRAVRGDVVVTDSGLEGGPVYAQARELRNQLAVSSNATVELDLQPDLSVADLAHRLSKRRAKATVTSWLGSAGFSAVAIAVMREATNNQIPSDAPEVASLAKSVPLTIAGLAPIDRAISTAGGIAQHEVDETFMLRRVPGVFVAGEMIDWDAPTGGYLLQVCFSTGVAAARGVDARLANR